MSFYAHGITITVLERSPGRDQYGDPIEPDSGAEPHTIAGCAIAPRLSDETTEAGRAGVVVGVALYAPAGADLLRSDRVEIGHVAFPGVWEVEGEPGTWHSPFTGWEPGLEVALRRAEG